MLKHSKRYCINGDGRFVFAHDRCIYCYRREILYPKQKLKQKKQYTIKPYSDKRQKLNLEYERKKKEKWNLLVSQGKNKCFFTNIILDPKVVPMFHHTLGRDGDLLSDMKYVFPCLFKPHRQYHDLKYDYESLEKIEWYFPWLQRIKIELPLIYHKEMFKLERANNGKISKENRNNSYI